MLIYLQMIDAPAEQSKFERLYQAYRRLMFTVARQILPTDQDAEDAVHDAFVKLAKHISKISDPVCPKTKALTVLVVERTSIDLLRKRRPTAALDEADFGVQADPAQATELARCLLQLPRPSREILLLRHRHGYSVREAAQLLGISEAAARKREQRAREQLYQLCKEAELL